MHSDFATSLALPNIAAVFFKGGTAMLYFTIEQRESLKNELLAQNHSHEQLNGDLQEALARLRSPAFGICTGCGGEITFRLLKANPFTTVCRQCQQAEAREETQAQH
jgi:RNA polymerase-binding transcription factor DksA